MRIDFPNCNIDWSIELDERYGCPELTVVGRYAAAPGEVLGQAVTLHPSHGMRGAEAGAYVVREITEKLTRAVGRRALGLDT